MISYYKDKDMFWFRIFGIGLSFEKPYKLNFSERYGYKKYTILFGYKITYLERVYIFGDVSKQDPIDFTNECITGEYKIHTKNKS